MNNPTLNIYLNDISRYQPLSLQQELALAQSARQGNLQARNQLIESYLILVLNIAYHNLRPGIDLMDLIQEGNIGLIKAVDMFNPAQGNRLSTLARFWVEKYILRFLRDKLDESVSLEMPIVDSGETLLLSETIEDRGSIMGDQSFKSIERIIYLNDLKKHLTTQLDKLPPNEQMVLQLSYGLNGYPCLTRKEISSLLRLTADHVSRLKTRALTRLKPHTPQD